MPCMQIFTLSGFVSQVTVFYYYIAPRCSCCVLVAIQTPKSVCAHVYQPIKSALFIYGIKMLLQILFDRLKFLFVYLGKTQCYLYSTSSWRS